MLTEHRVPTLNQTELPVLIIWRVKVSSDFLSIRSLELFVSTQRVLVFNSKLAKDSQVENKTFQSVNIQNIIRIHKDIESLDSKTLAIEYYTNHNIYKKIIITLEFPKSSSLYKFCEYIRFFRSLKSPIPQTTLQFQSNIKTHVLKMVENTDLHVIFPTLQALKNLLFERYTKGIFIPWPKVFENYTFYLVFLSKGLKDIIDSFFLYSKSNIVLQDLVKLTKYLFSSDMIFFRLYKQNKCNGKIVAKKIIQFSNKLRSDDILKSLYFIKSTEKVRINYFGQLLYFFKLEESTKEFNNYVSEKEFGIKCNFDNKFSHFYLNKMCKKGICVRIVREGEILYHSKKVLENLEEEISRFVQ